VSVGMGSAPRDAQSEEEGVGKGMGKRIFLKGEVRMRRKKKSSTSCLPTSGAKGKEKS